MDWLIKDQRCMTIAAQPEICAPYYELGLREDLSLAWEGFSGMVQEGDFGRLSEGRRFRLSGKL